MALNRSRLEWWSIGEAIDLGQEKSVTISLWNKSETQPHAAWFEELILYTHTHMHSDTHRHGKILKCQCKKA